MRALKFNKELRVSSDDALNDLSLLVKSLVNNELSLFISNSSELLWILLLPNESRLPQIVSSLGEIVSTYPRFEPRYWICRPPQKTVDKVFRIAGREVKSRHDLTWEELLRGNHQFNLMVKIVIDQPIPRSDMGSVIALEIATDNEYVAQQIRGWFGGACYDERKTTFVYDHELIYFFRPPLSAADFYPEGVLKPVPEFPVILRDRPEILTAHCLVCGKTNSGKTNTVKLILDQVIASKDLQGLLLIDIKGEYQDWARKNKIEYLEVGRHPKSLTRLNINPFMPPGDLRLSAHISYLATLFTISGFGGAGLVLPSYMKLILEEFYRQIWEKNDNEFRKALYLTGNELLSRNFVFNSPKHSMLEEFCCFWEKEGKQIFSKITGQSIGRNMIDVEGTISVRIRDLRTGLLNFFSYQENAFSPDQLLCQKVIVSLSGATKSEINFLLSLLSLFFVASAQLRGDTPKLKNLLVIEEAHRVMSRPTSDSSEISTAEHELADTMQEAMSELRSRGAGIVVVDQSPHMLVKGVIANTDTKVIHRLSSPLDQDELATATGLSDDVDLTSLDTGECLIKMEGMPVNRRIMRKWQ